MSGTSFCKNYVKKKKSNEEVQKIRQQKIEKINTWNQSIVQQLIRDGNFLNRFRKASPIGLIARTICNISFVRSMK